MTKGKIPRRAATTDKYTFFINIDDALFEILLITYKKINILGEENIKPMTVPIKTDKNNPSVFKALLGLENENKNTLRIRPKTIEVSHTFKV